METNQSVSMVCIVSNSFTVNTSTQLVTVYKDGLMIYDLVVILRSGKVVKLVNRR